MAANTRFATGVHAMVLLANEPDGLKTSEEIAGKLDINPVVVRRIFSLLGRAGLLESQKGPHGGSKLARGAKQITLGDIYRALDGGALFHAARLPGARPARVSAVLKRAFARAEEAVREELEKTTLNQIAKKASK
ncbi:MAG TPA: Rrf2 family transcriptional regulator [Acidobacteriaceae bacterium]|nr:Rrf2 family transcriptional regulator [Acidobacteriaceae bacterium]